MTATFEGQDEHFDVFDADGRYLGRMRTDIGLSNRPPPIFRNGRVYAVASGELGVPIVIRGEIVMSRRP
jgi:hypothetical protein